MEIQRVNWLGNSGAAYEYQVFTLPYTFDPNQVGNYIYAKVKNGFWCPIYIGEGELSERIGPSHHRADAIRLKGATHIHAHLNKIDSARWSEESDLLARHWQTAYAPVGCNVKVGG